MGEPSYRTIFLPVAWAALHGRRAVWKAAEWLRRAVTVTCCPGHSPSLAEHPCCLLRSATPSVFLEMEIKKGENCRGRGEATLKVLSKALTD